MSFVGGGTDLPSFYEQEDGAVISTAIDKYIYVTVKKHNKLFNETYRLNYSETEHADTLDEIRNDIARECLRYLHVDPPIYISTVGDLPAFSGLGSSSAFAVGLLNALHVIRGERVSNAKLAEEAAYIEISALKRPIGKQDQYASAIGGLNYLRFQKDHRVTIEPQHLPEDKIEELSSHSMMFWTDLQRDAGKVLSEQSKNTSQKMAELQAMRNQAEELRSLIKTGFDIVKFARLLSAGWEFKRSLTSLISNSRIDKWYDQAMEAGAIGGKLCGAGGGGFLLFVAPPECQPGVQKALSELNQVPVAFEPRGTEILMAD